MLLVSLKSLWSPLINLILPLVMNAEVLNVKGIEEVEFAVNDFDLSEKCEAIQSLDGYKAVWN